MPNKLNTAHANLDPAQQQLQQLQQQLLEKLHDVQLPEAIGWWPLALGWWLLICTTVILFALLCFYLIRKYRQNNYRKLAATELQLAFAAWQHNQNSATYLQSANAILKRVVLHLNSGEANISLIKKTHGGKWVAELKRYSELNQQTSSALAFESYKAKPQADINTVHQQLIDFVKSHAKPKQDGRHNA